MAYYHYFTCKSVGPCSGIISIGSYGHRLIQNENTAMHKYGGATEGESRFVHALFLAPDEMTQRFR